MFSLFARAMNEAHKVTGDTCEGSEHPAILGYLCSASTPRGSYTDLPYSLWAYLCDYPLDGWSMEHLTRIEHLTADPRPTLYCGAGSGRMAKWLLSQGIPCACIDISDDAIELMTRRGVACEKMNVCAMTFADSSHERVVLHSDGLLESMASPLACLTEAARVASDRVVVCGYQLDPAVTVPMAWSMDWNGEHEADTYFSHPMAVVEGILEGLGMTLVLRRTWSEDDAPPGGDLWGIQYLIEARW